MRGGTWNLLTGRNPYQVKREVIHLLTEHKLDFLCVQEGETYAQVLHDIPNYLYYTGGEFKDSKETGILVHSGHRVKKVRNRQVGNGWWGTKVNAHHSPRGYLRITIDGWLRLCSIHMPPAVDLAEKTPKDAYDDYVQIMRLVKVFFSLPLKTRVICGDWNQSAANRKPWSPRDIAKQVKAKVYSPNVGIDYALVKRGEVPFMKADHATNQGSDHVPVIFTVTRKG